MKHNANDNHYHLHRKASRGVALSYAHEAVRMKNRAALEKDFPKGQINTRGL